MASEQCRRRPFRRTWLYERHIRTAFPRGKGENDHRQGEVSNRMEKTPGEYVESVVRHVQFRPAPGLAALADFDLLVGRRLGCPLIGSGLQPLHPQSRSSDHTELGRPVKGLVALRLTVNLHDVLR